VYLKGETELRFELISSYSIYFWKTTTIYFIQAPFKIDTMDSFDLVGIDFIWIIGLGLLCLTSLSTTLQLYRGGQFYWW
jgi:hypothetical protein